MVPRRFVKGALYSTGKGPESLFVTGEKKLLWKGGVLWGGSDEQESALIPKLHIPKTLEKRVFIACVEPIEGATRYGSYQSDPVYFRAYGTPKKVPPSESRYGGKIFFSALNGLILFILEKELKVHPPLKICSAYQLKRFSSQQKSYVEHAFKTQTA